MCAFLLSEAVVAVALTVVEAVVDVLFLLRL
jgi:hypothetical protein